jgi:ATP synthase protein I
MSAGNANGDPFIHAVRRQAERAERGKRLTFWGGLSLIGGVGWMITLPAVAGAVLGRYLDGHFGTGIFWTLPLMMVGLGLGCSSAWRWTRRELHR